MDKRKLLPNQRLLVLLSSNENIAVFHSDSQGTPSAIAVSPHMLAHTGCLFQGFAFYCTIAIRVSEGPKPSCLPQVGTHCCCECPVDPAETEPSSVRGSALSHTQADFSSPFLTGDSRKLTASVPTSSSASRNSNSGRSLK